MTAAPPPPSPAAARLMLAQWLSPAFPTGGFAYSHGMEQAIAAGDLPDAAAVGTWVTDILAHGAGRSDAILMCHALAPDADHAALTALSRALVASAERLQEAEEQGSALTRTTNALLATDHPPAPWAIALGRAAQSLPLPAPEIAALMLQSFAAQLVSVAVRLVPLGQTAGQALIAALHPLILRLAAEAATAPLSAIGTATLRADLAAMRHETLDVRLFRT